MVRIWAALAGAAAVVLAGCSTSDGTGSASQGSSSPAHSVVDRVVSDPATYVALAPTRAVLIHWTRVGRSLSGTANFTSIESAPPSEWVDKTLEPVTGRIDGSRVRLSVQGEPTQYGTASGTSFTVEVRGPDGVLVPATFQIGSTSQYDRAATHLSSSVAVDNQAATLNSELPGLNAPFDSSTYLQGFPEDAGEMDQLEFESLFNQFDTTMSSGACETLSLDNGGIAYQDQDATQMGTSSVGLQSAISTTRQLIATVNANLQELQADETAAGFIPAGAPSPTAVSSAITGAQTLIAAAISQANAYIAEADSDLATVTQYVFSASQLNGCGLTVNQPTRVSQLS